MGVYGRECIVGTLPTVDRNNGTAQAKGSDIVECRKVVFSYQRCVDVTARTVAIYI